MRHSPKKKTPGEALPALFDAVRGLKNGDFKEKFG